MTSAAVRKQVVLPDSYAAFREDSSYRTTLMSNYLHTNFDQNASSVHIDRAIRVRLPWIKRVGLRVPSNIA